MSTDIQLTSCLMNISDVYIIYSFISVNRSMTLFHNYFYGSSPILIASKFYFMKSLNNEVN